MENEQKAEVAEIDFCKITDPRDIDAWIQQRAANPELIMTQYLREMVVIGQDWVEHGLDTTKGYVLSFNMGRMSWSEKGLEAASYRVRFGLNVPNSRTHGMYFVLDDKGRVIECVRTTPEIEDKIAKNMQFMQ